MIHSMLTLMLFLQLASSGKLDPDQTGRLTDLLADYQVNHDKVYKAKFAFVGKGIQVVKKGGATTVSDRWYLCIHEDASRRLDASSVMVSHMTGRHIESWKQYLQYDGKSLFRPNLRNSETFTVGSEEWINHEKKLKADRLNLAVPQPLRYLLRKPTGYQRFTPTDSVCGSEYLLSDSAELIECRYTKDGDIQAIFSLQSNFPVTLQITFGKKDKFFPIQTVHSVVLQKTKKTQYLTEIDWDHRVEYSVPKTVRLAQFPLSNTASEIQIEIEFDWRIGQQLRADLDPQCDDWRQPFKKLFDADWQSANSFAPPL